MRSAQAPSPRLWTRSPDAFVNTLINAQYGELDNRITDGWPAFDAALTQAEVPHEGHIYNR
jgi:carboxymethylenebutenolidase